MSVIVVATTDDEITACYPVMVQLRPHITESEFLARIRNQMKAGYQLAMVVEQQTVFAVAGFRIGENLAWGRFLSVDDLVVDSAQRSKGYGAMLLGWLKSHAAKQGCSQMHLDSGLQRVDAHRFYERVGMIKAGYHFVVDTSCDIED